MNELSIKTMRWVTFGQDGRVTGMYAEGCAPAPEGAIEVSLEQYDGHLDPTRPDLMLALVDAVVCLATPEKIAEWKQADREAMLSCMSAAQRLAHDLREADPEGWDAAQKDDAAARAVARYQASKSAATVAVSKD